MGPQETHNGMPIALKLANEAGIGAEMESTFPCCQCFAHMLQNASQAYVPNACHAIARGGQQQSVLGSFGRPSGRLYVG